MSWALILPPDVAFPLVLHVWKAENAEERHG
jgi:hypothetical protein